MVLCSGRPASRLTPIALELTRTIPHCAYNPANSSMCPGHHSSREANKHSGAPGRRRTGEVSMGNANSLRDIILPMATDSRLRHLAVAGGLRWDFDAGYAPLYLKGNWEQPERVKLVLMLAEPGGPDEYESFSTNPDDWFREAVLSPAHCKPFGTERQDRVFQQRIEWFLSECGFDLSESHQVWSQIVISNTFWLRVAGRQGRDRQAWASSAPKEAERYFIEQYLAPMLRCFPRADIVGAGGKAHARLAKTGVQWVKIGALAPPGCNQRRVRARQAEIAAKLRNKWERSEHV